MTNPSYFIRQLTDDIELPAVGNRSMVICDDEHAKVVLFAFAAGGGLAEHLAPMPAIILVLRGEAVLTVGSESVDGKPGTWIQMAAKTPHSIDATTQVVMLLTLLK